MAAPRVLERVGQLVGMATRDSWWEGVGIQRSGRQLEMDRVVGSASRNSLRPPTRGRKYGQPPAPARVSQMTPASSQPGDSGGRGLLPWLSRRWTFIAACLPRVGSGLLYTSADAADFPRPSAVAG